tara:strand:+ start:40487 stop:41476 length:990 start_codon:yes stop_codon:yes gene_type:complete
MHSDNYTPQQLKVSNLIKTELAKVEISKIKDYLKSLGEKLDDPESLYYLDKAVHSKISMYSIGNNSPTVDLTDLKRLFDEDIVLPNVSVVPVLFSMNIMFKPFNNVICDNLKQVTAKHNFNGEPLLQGRFEYMEVMLPTKRLHLPEFYVVLPAILNGLYVFEGGTLQSLTELANQIYSGFAPEKHQTRKSKCYMASFATIESIVKKVMSNPQPVNGRVKITSTIWNPDYELSPAEKSTIFNKYRGNKAKSKTFETLEAIYTEGMTQKELWEKSGFSRSTVKRYWGQIQALSQKGIDDLKLSKSKNLMPSRLSMQPSTSKLRRKKMPIYS